jgi:hypothetical protein
LGGSAHRKLEGILEAS